MEIYRSIEEVEEDEPANGAETVDEAAAEGSDPVSSLFLPSFFLSFFHKLLNYYSFYVNKIFRLPHLLSILSSRANDDKTPRFVKAKAAILSSQNHGPLLKNTFKLPSSEALVASMCLYNNR